MKELLDFALHLDQKLRPLIEQYGLQIYLILFLIVFAETGFVIFPFLPGDSLLLAVGVLCRSAEGGTSLNIAVIIPLLAGAAIIGDQVNYRIGKALGPRVFDNPKSKIFKKENLDKTHEFFERYGAKTITIARFVPFVRSFAPFVAGMGDMPYGKFCAYSIFGAFLWVTLCTGTGYLVGEAFGDKLHYAILALVGISLAPMIIEIVRHKMKRKRASVTAKDNA